jgi:integrase/recombinase XerD
MEPVKMTKTGQGTNLKFLIRSVLDEFYLDRRAQGLTVGSVQFYHHNLKIFLAYCESQDITGMEQLTPVLLRQFLLLLETEGHSPGGRHTFYRSIRAFLNWFEQEYEPEEWHNPIKRVPPPKVPQEQLAPVELSTVQKLTDQCEKGTFTGTRDKAIFLVLLDTGARAHEFLAVDLAEIDFIRGSILIKRGKGGKARTVFVSKNTRKALRAYLHQRNDDNPALWVTDEFERLTYWGLIDIIRRRAESAGIKRPSLHSFRRAFALNCLRNGMDIYSLQRLMGHAGLAVLMRYLKQTDEDLQAAHEKFSPVDRL